MANLYKRRRLVLLLLILLSCLGVGIVSTANRPPLTTEPSNAVTVDEKPNPTLNSDNAILDLDKLQVKDAAPKTGYSRNEFGNGWSKVGGCDTRNIILYRDLKDTILENDCIVKSGILNDPYTTRVISFVRGGTTSSDVQIDHVVALSDAWQKGAQEISKERRVELANDPLELLAVSGDSNQQKSDSDASKWLPSNREFQCEYVTRQISVKLKYSLWISEPEKGAMSSVLVGCKN